jgi:hypothetical protein
VAREPSGPERDEPDQATEGDVARGPSGPERDEPDQATEGDRQGQPSADWRGYSSSGSVMTLTR